MIAARWSRRQYLSTKNKKPDARLVYRASARAFA
jgi:hypothetical protein